MIQCPDNLLEIEWDLDVNYPKINPVCTVSSSFLKFQAYISPLVSQRIEEWTAMEVYRVSLNPHSHVVLIVI
jgi:hypothetical protein